MKNNKIELIYIDKKNWKQELHLFNIMNQTNNITHEFIMKRNVFNLYSEQDDCTITTKSKLQEEIKQLLSNSDVDNITIVDFEMTLEEVFNNMIDIAKEYGINIKIIEKSKYPIRSNVTLTIDLNEFDNKTKYNDIKEILENDLENSLNNARKSKSPRHSSDLGIDIKYQTDFLKELFRNINNEYDYENDIDIEDDIIFLDNELSDLSEFTNLKDEISKVSDIFTSHGSEGDMTIISYKDEINISKDLSSISINKTEARKLMKVLEVMINE